MTYQAEVIRILIASPGNLEDERQVVKDAIFQWNNSHSHEQKKVLLPVMWETHSAPKMGELPQKIINKQMVSSSDLIIAIFWNHIGTETDDYLSGTIEEIEEMLGMDKTAMIYFSDKKLKPSEINGESLKKVETYKAECFSKGLVSSFETISEFKELLSGHLTINIRDLTMKWFEDIETDDNNIIFRVGKCDHGIDVTYEAFNLFPFTQEERDLMRFLNTHASVDLIKLINKFGKRPLISLRKNRIIKIESNMVCLSNIELSKFVTRNCF